MKFPKVSETFDLTEGDRVNLHACMPVTGSKSRVGGRPVNHARKEATQTDKRSYAKQFTEAKHVEHKSWRDSEASDLVDMREVKCKHFVTGRWVLTVKIDKDGNFQNCKARGVLHGFLGKQKDEQ